MKYLTINARQQSGVSTLFLLSGVGINHAKARRFDRQNHRRSTGHLHGSSWRRALLSAQRGPWLESQPVRRFCTWRFGGRWGLAFDLLSIEPNLGFFTKLLRFTAYTKGRTPFNVEVQDLGRNRNDAARSFCASEPNCRNCNCNDRIEESIN